jgi:4-hydroxybenzoate polyprenyltransferase
MRIHQWLKNLLIFVPAATSHRILEPAVFRLVFLAFFSFSVCASAGYLINDVLDLKADRLHPAKRRRPFASGALSARFGLVVAALLFLTGVGLGNLVSRRYVLFLCGYLALTVAYSVALKTMLLVDIFLLAFFYTLRVFLGGEAAGVTVSFWLAAFSTFFFFSLAVIKRFTELRLLVKHDGGDARRRDYRAEDIPMLAAWGAASGCASIVVLALYINSEEVTKLYHHPTLLWPVCLAFLFWLNRIWMLANRNALPYDPILFAVKDWPSYVVAAFVAGSILLAI